MGGVNGKFLFQRRILRSQGKERKLDWFIFFFVWKNIMSAFSIKLESYYSKEVLKAI